MSRIKKFVQIITNNITEVATAVALFIGLPITLSLYTDYRAGLLLFFSSIVVVGITAIRKS